MNADYLRVSVTDRCNLRCIYCHPLDGCDFVERKEILRFEEIYRIVQLLVECGIRKVRLTGGEPLVRKNIVYLVEKLAGIEGIEELALTTNGVLLESLAAELKDAGLHHKQITGFDLLPTVTKGIYKALEVGLRPVKINSVIMRSINVSQIPLLAQMSVRLPVTVRFIEYCPTSKYAKPASDYVPTSKVREIIEFEFGHLLPVIADGTSGPASYFKIKKLDRDNRFYKRKVFDTLPVMQSSSIDQRGENCALFVFVAPL